MRCTAVTWMRFSPITATTSSCDVPPPEDGVRRTAAYRETWPPFFTWQRQGASFYLVTERSSPTAAASIACSPTTPSGLLNSHGLTARRAADGGLEWRIAGIPVQAGAA